MILTEQQRVNVMLALVMCHLFMELHPELYDLAQKDADAGLLQIRSSHIAMLSGLPHDVVVAAMHNAQEKGGVEFLGPNATLD